MKYFLAVGPRLTSFVCRVAIVLTAALAGVLVHVDSRAQTAGAMPDDLYRSCPEARWPPPDGADTATLSPGVAYKARPKSARDGVADRVVTRVGVWGDSHTASGDFFFAALQQWGITRNHVRPALIQPAFQVPGVRLPFKKYCLTAGWKIAYAQREAKQGGVFTQTLLQLRSETANDLLWMDFRYPHDGVRLNQMLVHYSKQESDRPLIIGISIDNQNEQYFRPTAESPSILQIQASQPFATVRLRVVVGQVSIQGFEPVYAEPPGLWVDVFSTPGAMAKVWSDIKPEMVGKPYDVAIFEYGTNEAMASDFTENDYTQAFRQSLTKFRALQPKARCIVVGPPERGGMSNLVSVPYSRVHQIISQVQARVAREQGCQAWNWQASLQSMGSVRQLLQASPPLMGPDTVHLTKEGYEASGKAFAKMIPWKF